MILYRIKFVSYSQPTSSSWRVVEVVYDTISNQICKLFTTGLMNSEQEYKLYMILYRIKFVSYSQPSPTSTLLRCVVYDTISNQICKLFTTLHMFRSFDFALYMILYRIKFVSYSQPEERCRRCATCCI